jgi:hypothetical protein
MKKLCETLEAQLVIVPNTNVIVDNLVSQWGGVEYPELGVVLVYLQFLYDVNQNHHWQSRGDSFYGDHLMFQRIYEGIDGQIDSVAEKAIGLGGLNNVDLVLQTTQKMKLVAGYGAAMTIPQSGELARRSLAMEFTFLQVVDHLVTTMKERGALTRGLDNLIAGIEDVHEGFVYLLKNRSE